MFVASVYAQGLMTTSLPPSTYALVIVFAPFLFLAPWGFRHFRARHQLILIVPAMVALLVRGVLPNCQDYIDPMIALSALGSAALWITLAAWFVFDEHRHEVRHLTATKRSQYGAGVSLALATLWSIFMRSAGAVGLFVCFLYLFSTVVHELMLQC